jgi:Flp pilus assembly pilin Flp
MAQHLKPGAEGSGLRAQGSSPEPRTLNPEPNGGQSIVEYLILIVVILLVVLAFRGPISNAMNNLYTESTNKVNDAAAKLKAVP